jgi:hypothetical protein
MTYSRVEVKGRGAFIIARGSGPVTQRENRMVYRTEKM